MEDLEGLKRRAEKTVVLAKQMDEAFSPECSKEHLLLAIMAALRDETQGYRRLQGHLQNLRNGCAYLAEYLGLEQCGDGDLEAAPQKAVDEIKSLRAALMEQKS